MTIEDMYSEDNNKPIKNKQQIRSNSSELLVHGDKTKIITINGEKIELVHKSYVDMIESELKSTARNLRTAQSRINQLNRIVGNLTNDVKELRKQLNARGRFD